MLRLASFDPVNDNGQSYGPQAFIDSIAKLSGGRLKVDVTTDYGKSLPSDESTLVTAIAKGTYDGGWPSTRAFAAAGIPGLEVVEAPMTLTSYAAEKELVTGALAGKLLANLTGTGVLGLGLAVGPLRRPFATNRPLLGPSDWHGARFRVFNSPVQSQAVTALGGQPVNLGLTWVDEVIAGRLRGAEFDIAQYATSGFGTTAGNVTANVVLWPKVFVLSLNRKRFDSLTTTQQSWVREAASRAVRASADATYDEDTPASSLCADGVRFHDASPAQLAALRTTVQPVIDGLARGPRTGPLLAAVQAIAARHPAADVPRVPPDCRLGTSEPGTVGAVPRAVSQLPDGVYRSQITHEEVAAGGFSNAGHPAGTWTLKIRLGTYEVFCRPLQKDGDACGGEDTVVPLEIGDVRGSGHTAYFVLDPVRLARASHCKQPESVTLAGHCPPAHVYRMTWAVNGHTLRFSHYVSAGSDDVFLIKPWLKIS